MYLHFILRFEVHTFIKTFSFNILYTKNCSKYTILITTYSKYCYNTLDRLSLLLSCDKLLFLMNDFFRTKSNYKFVGFFFTHTDTLRSYKYNYII